jgi:hypothetical protein
VSNPYDPYRNNPYGQNPYGQNPYGQPQPGQNPYPVYSNYGSYTDRDGVNEAALAMQVLGGPVRVDDSIEADIIDPFVFEMDSFTANAVVTAVADAAITDTNGDFSFLLFGTRGSFDFLVVEADTIQYARAFVARELKDWSLLQYLLKQKDAYLADPDATVYPCDLNQWGMGEWSMFAYRQPGRLLLRDGQFGFFNARANYPLEYIDFTLCPAGEEGPHASHWIRYMQVGHNQALIRGDVLDMSATGTANQSSLPVRVWRKKQEPPPKKKGLFGR